MYNISYNLLQATALLVLSFVINHTPANLTDPAVMSPYHHTSLPPKNGPLTSSIGSVATLTTVADEQVDPEECGRVAGWVANFDKLLQDTLGVKCLLVS